MSESLSFADEIDHNQNVAEVLPDVAHLETAASSLDVRLRGGYITNCELTSPTTGNRVEIFYADPEHTKPKLSASHVMMPAGPTEDIGGQHGYDRWADHHLFALDDGPNGEKRVAFQAMRSDSGPGIARLYELTESSVATHTTVSNPDAKHEDKSIGDHDYYALADGAVDGLTVNGQSLDELLGEGAQDFLLHDKDGTLFWRDFDGEAVITFPAGHSIKLTVALSGADSKVDVWFWKRPGTDSLCIEPVTGLTEAGGNDGLKLAPYGSATLSKTVELL